MCVEGCVCACVHVEVGVVCVGGWGGGTNNVKTSSEYSTPPVAQRYNYLIA